VDADLDTEDAEADDRRLLKRGGLSTTHSAPGAGDAPKERTQHAGLTSSVVRDEYLISRNHRISVCPGQDRYRPYRFPYHCGPDLPTREPPVDGRRANTTGLTSANAPGQQLSQLTGTIRCRRLDRILHQGSRQHVSSAKSSNTRTAHSRLGVSAIPLGDPQYS